MYVYTYASTCLALAPPASNESGGKALRVWQGGGEKGEYVASCDHKHHCHTHTHTPVDNALVDGTSKLPKLRFEWTKRLPAGCTH